MVGGEGEGGEKPQSPRRPCQRTCVPPRLPAIGKTCMAPKFCLRFLILMWTNLPVSASGRGWEHSYSPQTACCSDSLLLGSPGREVGTGEARHSCLWQESVTGDLRVPGVNGVTAGAGVP